MYDNNDLFGTINLAGTSGTAKTADSVIKDMIAPAKIDQYTPYVFVFKPAASVTGAVTIKLMEADAVSGSNDKVTLTSPTSEIAYTITNPVADKEYRFPFPFHHKRYINLQLSGEITVDIFAAVERLIH